MVKNSTSISILDSKLICDQADSRFEIYLTSGFVCIAIRENISD